MGRAALSSPLERWERAVPAGSASSPCSSSDSGPCRAAPPAHGPWAAPAAAPWVTPSSDQPLSRGHLDHVPHFHSGPVFLLPARAVRSLSRSPPLHGNRRGYNHCEEQGSPRSPDCSHHGGVAEVRPHSLLW